MGAQFSRLKVWVKEKLKVSDLNGEFNNILMNLTPAGIDDASANAVAMQAMENPFPGQVLSMPTSSEGEIRRLRFMLAAITGNAYWYGAPAKTIQTLSNLVDQALTASQWGYETATPTYISTTQFSLATDRTADFPVGRRVRATVTAGLIYGTVTSATSTGTPTVTTITARWDSGALDTGLSAINPGIISPLNNALPILPTTTETATFSLSRQDCGKTIYTNSGTAINCTLLAANTVPSGWWVDIINLGAGALTLVGTVEGVTNPVLAQRGRLRLMSNGTAWNGRMVTKVDIGLGNVDNTADANKNVSYAATAGSVALGSITQAHLAPVIATTGGTGPGAANPIILGNAPTQRSTTSTTYVKLKEFAPLLRGGVVVLSFAIGNGHSVATGNYRVYKDGVFLGVNTFACNWGVDGNSQIIFLPATENISVSVGSVISIYGKTSHGSVAAHVKSAYITGYNPIAEEVL